LLVQDFLASIQAPILILRSFDFYTLPTYCKRNKRFLNFSWLKYAYPSWIQTKNFIECRVSYVTSILISKNIHFDLFPRITWQSPSRIATIQWYFRRPRALGCHYYWGYLMFVLRKWKYMSYYLNEPLFYIFIKVKKSSNKKYVKSYLHQKNIKTVRWSWRPHVLSVEVFL